MHKCSVCHLIDWHSKVLGILNNKQQMKTIIVNGEEYQLTPIKEVKTFIVRQEFDFEIHPYELGPMKWDEAISRVQNLGEGWRLPTFIELQLIRESKYISMIKHDKYWSSSENGGTCAWSFNFVKDFPIEMPKYLNLFVIAVRDFGCY